MSMVMVGDRDAVQLFFQLFSFVIKTKVVQNVNMMSERQKDMPADSQTDRQTDKRTDRQIERQNDFSA